MGEQQLIEAARATTFNAIVEASRAMLAYWPNPQNVHFDPARMPEIVDHKGGPGNYATIADHAAEQSIIAAITSNPLFRGHGIVAEESGANNADAEWRWVIDPIDGTLNFRHGNPDFGVCIALFKGNTPMLGAIAQPAIGQVAMATIGTDAMLFDFNGRPIANLRQRASQYDEPLERALVGYDVGYAKRGQQLQQFVVPIADKVGYAVSIASFSTGNMRLLQGMMAAYFGSCPTVMDVAPAAALIPAVGGVVTDMQGRPIDWRARERTYLAAINPQIHARLLELLS